MKNMYYSQQNAKRNHAATFLQTTADLTDLLTNYITIYNVTICYTYGIYTKK